MFRILPALLAAGLLTLALGGCTKSKVPPGHAKKPPGSSVEVKTDNVKIQLR